MGRGRTLSFSYVSSTLLFPLNLLCSWKCCWVLVSVIDQVQLCGTPSFWIMGRPQHRCHLLFQEFLLLFLLFGQFQHIFFIYS